MGGGNVFKETQGNVRWNGATPTTLPLSIMFIPPLLRPAPSPPFLWLIESFMSPVQNVLGSTKKEEALPYAKYVLSQRSAHLSRWGKICTQR